MRSVTQYLFGFLALFALSYSAHAKVTLIENATILSLAHGDDEALQGYILFDEKQILEIKKGGYKGDEKIDLRIDASNKLVIPGFISGHNHLWQSAFRGIAADKELWGWLKELHFTYGAFFEDGDFYNFTLHGALDQLSKGITSSYNHSQRLKGTEQQYLESFQAELDAGQHFIFSYNANMWQDIKQAKKDIEAFVSMAKPYIGKSPLLNISIHSVGAYTGDPKKLKLEMDMAKKYKITAQLHYAEEYQRRFLDRKKWAMFKKAGAIDDFVSYAHFIHPNEAILKDAAEKGASMIWNPLSNGRLASGLANIPKYESMGIGVGMGVDGAASADIADPFENMRMGMYALRMQEKNANVMLPIEILRLHTLKTAEVLKIGRLVGSLEVGKKADLLIVDPSTPGTGAMFDAAATLVFACNASNISHVFVNGALKVEQGILLEHDMENIQKELVSRVSRIRENQRASL